MNTQQKVKQAHRDNILRNIEHRLEVAKKTQNNYLIEQLEAEKGYYRK